MSSILLTLFSDIFFYHFSDFSSVFIIFCCYFIIYVTVYFFIITNNIRNYFYWFSFIYFFFAPFRWCQQSGRIAPSVCVCDFWMLLFDSLKNRFSLMKKVYLLDVWVVICVCAAVFHYSLPMPDSWRDSIPRSTDPSTMRVQGGLRLVRSHAFVLCWLFCMFTKTCWCTFLACFIRCDPLHSGWEKVQ